MLLLAVVVAVVLWDDPAAAIKWEFDDGTTQGWSAKEALVWGGVRELHQFPGEVEDGVWRVAVDPAVTKGINSMSSVELISPRIGYDSSLFDHVRIRCRTVHDRPTEGTFSMAWTNEHNALSSGWDPEYSPSESRFEIFAPDILYTTEWQELVLSLVGPNETIWEGLLKDIQLSFFLNPEPTLAPPDPVAWFEIDWIELTGVEELLQGELPPPSVEYFRFDGVGLFAPPVFYPIVRGIGQTAKGAGVLTDLDGDGALDLFALYEYAYEKSDMDLEEEGWLIALNDGHGALELRRVENVTALGGEANTDAAAERTTVPGVALEVLGADLTGDGQAEIVLSRSNREPETEVWSIGPDLQVEVLAQIDSWVHSVVDWDGDGRVELFVGGARFEGSLAQMLGGTAVFSSSLSVWEVAQGVWTAEEVAAAKNYRPFQIGDFTGDGILNVLWTPIANQAKGWIIGTLGEALPPSETAALPHGELFGAEAGMKALGVGDFDGDGQVDVLAELIRGRIEGSKGLVWLSKGGGDVEASVLYDDRLLRRSPVLMRDLNADGIDDWVFVGGDRASGLAVFIEWGGGVQPTQDRERHRLTGSGTHVLSGDMDGDGDEDLVVLDPVLGGVHVLKNSLASTATAVQMSAAARPAQYRLGDSYPNPFNPTVVLPLDLAKDAAEVSLRVHDVLGRRVRQVWQGPLGAGSHRFVWDGRDEAGRAVAAGVYIYRVEMDGRVEAKKMTKLP